MAVKDGLPATDFSKINRDYIRNVAEGETVKDGLPATDFSRMNREYIKAVVEEAGGGGSSDFSVATIRVNVSVPGKTIIGGMLNDVWVDFPTGNDKYGTSIDFFNDSDVDVLVYQNYGYLSTISAIDSEHHEYNSGELGFNTPPVGTGGVNIDVETISFSGDGTLTVVINAE